MWLIDFCVSGFFSLWLLNQWLTFSNGCNVMLVSILYGYGHLMHFKRSFQHSILTSRQITIASIIHLAQANFQKCPESTSRWANSPTESNAHTLYTRILHVSVHYVTRSFYFNRNVCTNGVSSSLGNEKKMKAHTFINLLYSSATQKER